jgi:hypothetical protein
MSNTVENIILKTYRFVLSNQMIDYLSEFSKIHQHDDRKTFKEEWAKWIKDEDIEPIINEEIKHLKNTGFTGDVVDKMFKSARYYYRNKLSNNEPKEKKERKIYETLPIEILEKIDMHIHNQIHKNANKKLNDEIKISCISPAESFNLYLQENKLDMINYLKQHNESDSIKKKDVEDMMKRFKKTYKNRFYNIRVSMNN